MPLDITMIDADEYPVEGVSLETGIHNSLMKAAMRVGMGMLLRFFDYYGEASIEVEELPGLIEECSALLGDPELVPELRSTLKRIRSLAEQARQRKLRIFAIPD